MSAASDDLDTIYKATQHFQKVRFQHWINHDLFSLAWWFLLVITVVPWIVWWKFADKKRLPELVCVGAIIALISVLLDSIGTVNLWWIYKVELIIHFPGLLVADMSGIPVAYMLVYQYCPTWKSFVIAMGIVSLLFSFVIEPAFRVMQAYHPLTWEHVYSFITYMLMGVLVRFVVLRMQPEM